jgi:hypothetical protein
LKQLLRINDELMRLCKWLNEKRDIEISSRLIPLVDDLTHILIEAGKNKLHLNDDATTFSRLNVYTILIGTPMNQETVDSVSKQMFKAFDLCLEKEIKLPALLLAYTLIDIAGWLDCGDGNVRKRFTAWVDRYLLPGTPLGRLVLPYAVA